MPKSLPLPSELLRKAYALLAEGEHRWIKFYLAQAIDGNYCPVNAPEAVCFCAIGALDRSTMNVSLNDYINDVVPIHVKAENYLRAETPRGFIGSYNDLETTTYVDILALYSCAIAKAENDERNQRRDR